MKEVAQAVVGNPAQTRGVVSGVIANKIQRRRFSLSTRMTTAVLQFIVDNDFPQRSCLVAAVQSQKCRAPHSHVDVTLDPAE